MGNGNMFNKFKFKPPNTQRDVNNELLKIIKSYGFTSSKDPLGFYFNRKNERFSVNVTGSFYQCYHNTLMDGNWTLHSKSDVKINYSDALRWVVVKIKEGID